MGWINREPPEPALPSDLNQVLVDLRQKGSRCPKPEVLQAAQADVLPDQVREDVAKHLESCATCKSLLAALEVLDGEQPSRLAQQRIWRKIEAQIGAVQPSRKGGRLFTGWASFWLRPVPLAAAASAILLLAGSVFWVRNQKQPGNEVAQNHPVLQQATPPASVLKLEKAPIVLPASAVLVWRGQQDSTAQQASALKQALKPYETDNYREAARRLERVRKQYPQMAPAAFYLGICQLFLNQNEDAMASLKDAKNLAKPPLQDDVSWYLALAEHRLGKDDLASPLLGNLCKAGGKDSARACAGAEELGARH